MTTNEYSEYTIYSEYTLLLSSQGVVLFLLLSYNSFKIIHSVFLNHI